jgi:hypothetical protein
VVAEYNGSGSDTVITEFTGYTLYYIVIYGSNFEPGDSVQLTICAEDTVLVAAITANACGAFQTASIELREVADTTGVVVPEGMHSVKAWVSGERWACWPLEVNWMQAPP